MNISTSARQLLNSRVIYDIRNPKFNYDTAKVKSEFSEVVSTMHK